MTRISVIREPADPGAKPYRAVAGASQASGRTAGEALDALAEQLGPDEVETLVIVRKLGPDRFFTAEQRRRLE